MSTNINRVWVDKHLLPGGHTIFTNDSGEVAIADESGTTPETTDDGVLWLDLSGKRMPIIGSMNTVPVLDANENQTSVPVEIEDIFVLAPLYWRGQVNVRGIVFTIMRGTPMEDLRKIHRKSQGHGDQGAYNVWNVVAEICGEED